MATFFLSALLSIGLPFVISLHASPIFLKDRYTIIALPPLALVIGMVCDGVAREWPRRLAVFVVLALWIPIGLVNVYRYWTRYQEFDWRGGISIVEGQWREGDALVFVPEWLKTSYTDNGGNPRRVASITTFAPVLPPPDLRRLWIFAWEQNPEKEQMDIVATWLQRPGAMARIDFPHIKLWEIPVRGNGD
jgi:hypothetical protein